MSITFFNTHSLAGRLEIILAQGTFLAERGRRGYHIELYDMGNFFAEVWTNPETNFIGLIRGLASKRALEPYTKQINLLEMMCW
ncbi:MAG: hypothetical protein LPK09_07585 [Hymenobacteraceae bacterium]|nr:hypothetical protein [Hymenobacteraceae bacterium]